MQVSAPAIRSNILLSSQARGGILRFEKSGTQSREAFELYLQGLHFFRERSHDGLFKGIASFKRAIEKDPNFALAYAGLAEGYAGDLENLRQVDPLAQKALALNPKLAEPHATLGYIRIFRDHNWPDAERELKQSVALAPDLAKAHQYYAAYLAITADLDRSEKEIRQAIQLDPESLSASADLAQILYFKRHYEGAIDESGRVLQRDPQFFDAHMIRYHAYTLSGKYDQAFDEYLKIIQLWDYYPRADLEQLRQSYSIDRPLGLWLRQIELFHFWGIAEIYKAYEIAESYALLGNKSRALSYLEKACDKPINYSLVYLKVNPIWDNLRDDPRFEKLVRRLGLKL